MKCILCDRNGIIELQQGSLCRQCFPVYFQKKVYKNIRKYRLFTKNDVLCFALSGGKNSLTAAYVVSQIGRKQKQRMVAVHAGAGKKKLKEFCDGLGIEYHSVTSRGENGLVPEARKLGATRIIVGNNLDNEAQEALVSMLEGNLKMISNMGPKPETVRKSIPIAKPLYFCTEEETDLFTKLKCIEHMPDGNGKSAFRKMVKKKLDEIDDEYTGTKTSIVQNIVKLLPALKGKTRK